MVIITKRFLNEYARKNAQALNPLNEWYTKTEEANWSNLMDMKQTFGTVDYVGNDRYVFNIKGNSYRLIALVHFSIRTVYIRFIGTHAEYDKIDASSV